MRKAFHEIAPQIAIIFGVGAGIFFILSGLHHSEWMMLMAFIYLVVALRISSRLVYIPNTPAQGEEKHD